MNLVDIYTKPITVSSSNQAKANFKEDSKNLYKDPLRKWPIKGLAYSNELGAVVSGITPKLGTALWVPALMYFGADIYDKYKNDKTEYNPSKRRGLKEAIFQAMASVVMPTIAVKMGQNTISSLNRFTPEGLTTTTKQTVIEKSLAYMQSKSLHTYVDKPAEYAEGFKNAILTIAGDMRGDFKALSTKKKTFALLNPLKNIDSISFANEEKLSNYAQKQALLIMEMRSKLMNNEKPKQLSAKLFKKFQNIKGEYKKIYPADRYMGKAVKSILKDFHKQQIFKNKMIKTLGGFIALALMLKPIDEFVEHFIIKKTVEPGLDYISNGLSSKNKNKISR